MIITKLSVTRNLTQKFGILVLQVKKCYVQVRTNLTVFRHVFKCRHAHFIDNTLSKVKLTFLALVFIVISL